MIHNTKSRYGWMAICLHWVSALVVLSLFGLGLWMTDLDYYHSWYKTGPDLHRAIGVLLLFLLLFRVVWRARNVLPDAEPNISSTQQLIAHRVHQGLYLLLFLIITTGYLISTADGRPVDVFGLFSIPALVSHIEGQADLAGAVHWYLALLMMALVVLHAAAALKHHFIDKDKTLLKMLGRTQ